ncbi:unnamed protein product [Lampetra planeri]
MSHVTAAVLRTPATRATMEPLNLKGLIAAPFTPLTEQGEVNLPVIAGYVDYLVHEQGVKSIFLNGTTGEGPSLTVAERKLLTEEWIKQGKNKLTHVIIHVGANAITEAQQLAKHAQDAGATAIALMAPNYFKPLSLDAIVNFIREVAAAAPKIPCLYYHIPEFTGVNVSMYELCDGIREKIPTFAGVKFCSLDLLELGCCISRYGRELSFYYAKDEQLLSALVLGTHGAVGSTYNYMGKLNNSIIEALDSGKLEDARKHQFTAQELLKKLFTFGFGVAENKVVMSLVSGLPLGPPRAPLLNRSPESFLIPARLELERAGFLKQ